MRCPTPTLASLARCRAPRDASRQQAVRYAEIRRLALALREGHRELKANRTQLQAIVNDLAPGLTDQPGIGPVSAAQAIVSFSHPGRCRNDAAFAALAGTISGGNRTRTTAEVTDPVTTHQPSLPDLVLHDVRHQCNSPQLGVVQVGGRATSRAREFGLHATIAPVWSAALVVLGRSG